MNTNEFVLHLFTVPNNTKHEDTKKHEGHEENKDELRRSAAGENYRAAEKGYLVRNS
jgi:hypothetical protein